MTNPECKRQDDGLCRALQSAPFVVALLAVTGCASLPFELLSSGNQKPAPFAHAQTSFREGNYEAALKENQRLLGEHPAHRDVALFNIGLISAYSSNPRKDYPRALNSFKALLIQYPQSPLADHAKVWILTIEEHQRVADDRQKLLEEKRLLAREREVLSQEREKQKYIAERSRQLDLEIEKRRRQTLGK
jgi:predicted Zn-dependent protease